MATSSLPGLLDSPMSDPAFKAWDKQAADTKIKGAMWNLLGLAGGIEDTENARYGQGLGTLQTAYGQSQQAMGGIDPNLLFSKAADSIGARAGTQLDALRQSLGARGMNPNSGAASGMLQRLAFERENALTGATRDIAIENQRQRNVAAAQNFANALNLAQYTNSPVPGARLDATQNILEGLLAYKGLKNAKNASDKANISGLIGAGIGGASSILGGLL